MYYVYRVPEYGYNEYVGSDVPSRQETTEGAQAMLADMRMLRDRIEVATEELARILAAPHNAVKITDREREIATMNRQLERIEAIHRAFQDRRAELLARCGQFRVMH